MTDPQTQGAGKSPSEEGSGRGRYQEKQRERYSEQTNLTHHLQKSIIDNEKDIDNKLRFITCRYDLSPSHPLSQSCFTTLQVLKIRAIK